MAPETTPGSPGFALFRQRVQDDPVLQQRLRRVDEREAFFEAAVALGAEHGFSFSIADVAAALREGQLAWMNHWMPVA